MKARAFSIIELAIALTLIGLIIAGVLAGTKLASAAKLQSVINETRKISQASHTFQLSFEAFPGDMNDAHQYFRMHDCAFIADTATTELEGCNGNGDGFIAGDGLSDGSLREEHNFWNHLRYYRLLEEITPAINSSFTAKRYIGLSYAVISHQVDNNPNFLDNQANFIRLGKKRNSYIANVPHETYQNQGKIFSPQDAKTIDQKIDDGNAYRGFVTAYNGYDDNITQDGNCSSDEINAQNSTDYQVQNPAEECYLLIRLERVY